MTDILYKLQDTYFYLNFLGKQYAVQLSAVAIFSLILLLIVLVLLIVVVSLGRSKSGAENETAPTDPNFDPPEFAEVKERIRAESLSELYARERGLVICPFCETYNSPKFDSCCACGQRIRK